MGGRSSLTNVVRLFEWNSGVESEAYAISNLQSDDVGSITLNNVLPGGLTPNQTIQLLTSQGGDSNEVLLPD